MFTLVKISVITLIAIVALPPYALEPTLTPSEPSAISGDAMAGAPPPDRAQQVRVAPDLRTAQASADVAHDQMAMPEGRATDRPTPAPPSLGKLPLKIGDSLKIGFYETIDVGSNGQNGGEGPEPQGALRTFYQRMDLSGDYAVDQDGAVSIPLLGRIEVEGRSLDDVRADLAASFAAAIGRNANIDLKILDRAPIYVVGPVKNPGAYKYAPGMIVLQAIALAGGLDRGPENLPGMVEGAREMERLRIAALQVEQLLAQRARLEAERDGVSALSIPDDGLSALQTPGQGVSTLPMPVQLTKLDREKTAGTFLASQSAILSAEQDSRRQQDQEIALRVVAARNEVNELKRKLDQFDVEKELRNERLNAMQKLKDRGVVTTNNVLVLRTELADLEARREDSLVAVVQAEARLAEAEGNRAKLSSENTVDLAKKIAAVDEEIAASREAAMSARALATVLYRPNDSTAQATYEIVRQSKEGAKNLQATETSPLMPGDVLKVNLNSAAAIDPSSVVLVPQSPLVAPPNTHTASKN